MWNLAYSRIFICIFISISFVACNEDEETSITSSTIPGIALPTDRLIVRNVSFNQGANSFTATGVNINRIEKVELKNQDGKISELKIDSKSNTALTSTHISSETFSLLSNSIVELIFSTATGAATVPLTFTVDDGTITAGKLDNNSVTTDKISDGSVTGDKIDDLTITLGKIHNSGAADQEVVTWSDAEGKWIPVSFATLQSSDGAVEKITTGNGFKDKGTEITSSGTLNLDIGNTAGKIPQFDSRNGSLTIVNDLIIDSNGANGGKIGFNIDGDAAYEYTIEASGSGLSFKEAGSEVFYVHSNGSLVIPELSIGGAYELPETDGALNQILVTNGNGKVKWTNLSDVATNNLSIKATAPLNFDSDSNTVSLNNDSIESALIKDDTLTNSDINSLAGISRSKLALFPNAEKDKVLISNLSGEIAASTVTKTQLEYLDGLSGSIKDTFLSLSGGGEVRGNTEFSGNIKVNNPIDGSNIISNDNMSDDSVTSNEIKDGAITNDDIQNLTIEFNKLKQMTDTQRVLISDARGTIVASTITSEQINFLSGLTGNVQSQINSISSISSNDNAGLGENALANISTGRGNVAIGYQAGASLKTGEGNVLIGALAGRGFSENTDNMLIIGNALQNLIEGNFSSQKLALKANTTVLGLEVKGDLSISDELVVDDDITVKGDAKLENDLEVTGTFTANNVSNIEFNYLDGVTSPIQNQINAINNGAISLYIKKNQNMSSSIHATCNNGDEAISGGCSCASGLEDSYPKSYDYNTGTATAVADGDTSFNRWSCECTTISFQTAYVICLK